MSNIGANPDTKLDFNNVDTLPSVLTAEELSMRWIPEHAKAISELKVRLDESPRYGGEWKQRRMKRERLVSDRRLLRYLLKNGMNVERSAKAFEETLCIPSEKLKLFKRLNLFSVYKI